MHYQLQSLFRRYTRRREKEHVMAPNELRAVARPERFIVAYLRAWRLWTLLNSWMTPYNSAR